MSPGLQTRAPDNSASHFFTLRRNHSGLRKKESSTSNFCQFLAVVILAKKSFVSMTFHRMTTTTTTTTTSILLLLVMVVMTPGSAQILQLALNELELMIRKPLENVTKATDCSLVLKGPY